MFSSEDIGGRILVWPNFDILLYSMTRIGEHKDVGCYTVEGGKHIIKSSYRRQPRARATCSYFSIKASSVHFTGSNSSFEAHKSLIPCTQALLWFSSVQFSSMPFLSVTLLQRKLIKA